MNRRAFVKAVVAAGVASAASRSESAQPDPWADAEAILRRIEPPLFPARTFRITAYGAASGKDATAPIRDAIAACHAAGGGRVVVPAGRYETGPIVLESNVNLVLDEGATLAFSRDPAAYLPAVLTRFEGVELMNFSPFIYAFEQENIAVTGRGTLDGQAGPGHWWGWKRQEAGASGDRARLFAMAARGVPVAERRFGAGHVIRPTFVQPYRCSNVLVEGVTIVNSPMWEINPVLCRNVVVRGVTVRSHGPNNDGCNPESCRDVLIERCLFDTGDDCIALKSGRNHDGRRLNVPIENVVVRDCEMKDGHGGVVVGSEISGGARNIFVERCRMDSPRLDRALRFKTNAERGGVIERIAMRDVTIGEVAEAVVTADFNYEEGDTGAFTPVLRDIDIRGVTSRRSKYVCLLKGYERSPISNLRVADCRFDGVERPDVLQHVDGLVFTNVRVNGTVVNP